MRLKIELPGVINVSRLSEFVFEGSKNRAYFTQQIEGKKAWQEGELEKVQEYLDTVVVGDLKKSIRGIKKATKL